MDAAVNYDRTRVVTEMEENQKIVREMVLDSYQNILDGKGRKYKDFFAEIISKAEFDEVYNSVKYTGCIEFPK